MGFDTEFVVSSEDHYTEFVCCICVQLAQPPTVAQCSHVFCFGCIDEWQNGPSASQVCPKCKADLSKKSSTQPLKQSNPLAWRVLSRVKIKCPLGKQGCNWQGDYSELDSHLTNSSEHTGSQSGDQDQSAEANAIALKDQANREFEARNFEAAIKLYSKAISVSPNLISPWSNRAAARLMLGLYDHCISDCDATIKMDPTFVKGYVRKSRALVQKGLFDAAINTLSTGYDNIRGPPPAYGEENIVDPVVTSSLRSLEIESTRVKSLKAKVKNANEAIDKKDFQTAGKLVRQVMAECYAASIELLNAQVELGLGRIDRAQSITLQVLRKDSGNADAYCVRAVAFFYNEEFDDGTRLVKQSLRLDPDNVQAKKVLKLIKGVQQKMAEVKSSNRDFERLRMLFTEIIDEDVIPKQTPLYASVMAERANAHYRLQMHAESLSDCAKAIYSKDDCKKAWLTKRLALHGLGRHEEASAEMQKLMQGWGQNDATIRHAAFKADFELRKSKRPDYYALLQIPSVSTEGEIKRAYKDRALQVHPDKHAMKAKKEVEKAATEFKLLSEGLEILGDPMKRQLYDEGYDKAAIDERVQAAQRAARRDDHGSHHH
eukprot:m.198119 g.198119  ORF g.198119 m.198119 type:complete len:602 (+) comp32680_c0_seq2:305-2110(+)